MEGTVTISLKDFKNMEAKAEATDKWMKVMKEVYNFKPDGQWRLMDNPSFTKIMKENNFTIPKFD